MSLFENTFNKNSELFKINDSDDVVKGLINANTVSFLLPFIPKEGMILTSTKTGAMLYLHGVPESIPTRKGGKFIDVGYEIKFLSKAEYHSRHNNSSTFNIQNINAPSIIGNQNNPVLNVGVSMDELSKLIASKNAEDQIALNELYHTLKTIIENNEPVPKGVFSKFVISLDKYSDVATAIGSILYKLSTTI